LSDSFTNFSMDSKQASNSLFLVDILSLYKTFFFLVLALTLQTWRPNAHEMARKNEKKVFLQYVLELNFATINGLGQPSCQRCCTLICYTAVL
jgi:hypothetical protein